jgi:hypothetical protein
MSGFFAPRAIALAGVVTLLSGAAPAAAQDWVEKLSIHGSLNAGAGKSDGLGVLGINKDGTTDYRAVALQVGYKLGDNSRVVVQLLHRALGTSPLKAIEPTLAPVWAFYEHRVGNTTVKLGRNPLPRGLFNEVRFIGTLLPFYRVGSSVYGETLENIDGIVVGHRFDLSGGWGLEATAFGGGFGIKATLPGANGVSVLQLREEETVGGQIWLRTPIEGLRFGAFAASYQPTPSHTLPEKPDRQLTTLFSVDGDFARGFARGEYTRFTNPDTPKPVYSAYYLQGGIKVTEKFTIATEYNTAHTYVTLPQPFPAVNLHAIEDIAGGINYAPAANVKFKFELHRQQGYNFDSPVPTFVPPTRPPLVMGLAPRSRSNYAIASVAVSF